MLAHSAAPGLLPRGKGRGVPAALGADAAPTRPTSGTLTPATRSRARSSCALPVSGRGPALVTGGGGPGAAGAGRAAGAGCLRRAPSSPGASSRPRAAAEPPRPLPPASKVRDRGTEAGLGRSGAPGAGALPAGAARLVNVSPGGRVRSGARGRGGRGRCPRDPRRTGSRGRAPPPPTPAPGDPRPR